MTKVGAGIEFARKLWRQNIIMGADPAGTAAPAYRPTVEGWGVVPYSRPGVATAWPAACSGPRPARKLSIAHLKRVRQQRQQPAEALAS